MADNHGQRLNLRQNSTRLYEFVGRDNIIVILIFIAALLFGFLLSNKVPFKLVLTFKPLPDFSLETIENYTEKYSNMMDKLKEEHKELGAQKKQITKLEREIAKLEVTNSTLEEKMKGKQETINLQDKQITQLNKQLKGCHDNFNTIAGTINLLDGRHATALQCTETGDIECYSKVARKWESVENKVEDKAQEPNEL